MNILYLINYAGKGGSEKYIRIMIEYMLANKHNVHFMYNHKGALCDEVEKLGIKPIQLTMKNPFDNKAASAVAKYCKEQEIQIIHTQFQRENYIALKAKKKCNVGVIYTSHIVLKNNIIWKLMNYFITKKNDAIIAVCKMLQEMLIQNKMPAKKITTIYNGVELKDTINYEKKILNEFGIKQDEFLFVSLTRFTPEKGVPFLLKSVKELISMTDKPFKLLLAGDGDDIDECKVYVKQNGLCEHVIFMGYRTDTDELLSSSHVYINSSQSEALSFAILEAMSKGLPVILTNVGGNSELITDNGILLEYGDTNAMAKAMLKLMDDNSYYKQCSQESLKSVKEEFSLENQLNKTYEIYQSVSLHY